MDRALGSQMVRWERAEERLLLWRSEVAEWTLGLCGILDPRRSQSWWESDWQLFRERRAFMWIPWRH